MIVDTVKYSLGFDNLPVEVDLKFSKLILILLMFLFINSCGEGETAEEWFAFEEIAPVSDIYYAKDSLRESDNAIYLHMSGDEGTGSLLKKYEFVQVLDNGEVDSKMTTVTSFSELGFTNPRILDLAVSYCLKRPYAIVSDGTERTYFVDFINKTRLDVGRYYNYASLWVDDCNGYVSSHAFMAAGGVLTDSTGSKNISDISSGGFFVYNSTSGNFEIVVDAFDGLGNLSDVFEDATDIRVVPSRGDEVTKFISAIVFVNADRRFKVFQWRDSDNGFFDDTTRFSLSFSGLNVKVNTFDFKGTDLSSSMAHICVVGEDDNSDGYRVYMWNPSTTYSDVPGIDTDYPGKCSVINHSEITQYLTLNYPWVSYHSAKNELSLVWRPDKTSDIKSMLIDKAKSSNWVFASRFNFISKGKGAGPIMIFYDDNEYLKLAVCKKHQDCTLN